MDSKAGQKDMDVLVDHPIEMPFGQERGGKRSSGRRNQEAPDCAATIFSNIAAFVQK